MASPVLLWFRKDLRLDDNLALLKAVRSGRPVIPVYIHTPRPSPYAPLGTAQDWWLHHSLKALGRVLREKGSRIVLRSGVPETVLSGLIAETGAEVVAVNTVPDPQAIAADDALKQQLGQRSIGFHAFEGVLLHDPARLLTGSGGGFRVYTPFWRALSGHAPPSAPLEAPGQWQGPESWPEGEQIEDWNLTPSHPDWAEGFGTVWTPGEQGARERLDRFAASMIKGYAVNRDFPGMDGTSGLSPHLAFGELSPRRAWQAIEACIGRGPSDEDVSRYLKELVWREFSYHLLHHFPDLGTRNWNAGFDAFQWETDHAGLIAWQRGLTGYPIVDAGMRQLWREGWMHNRVRMITGSFLIKDLLIDWRIGEAWFRDTLVDADAGSNPANWQWVAGSGADASPFFRVFNPILQGEKFDPDGAYVRTYVPELAKLPNSLIHRPFEASPVELKAAGVSLGENYPRPLIEHRFARDRALARLSQLKNERDEPYKKIREN